MISSHTYQMRDGDRACITVKADAVEIREDGLIVLRRLTEIVFIGSVHRWVLARIDA